jgi:hypothetical protein
MSGGWVDLATWRDRLLPLLVARLVALVPPGQRTRTRVANVVFDAPAPGGDLATYGAAAGAVAALYADLLGMRLCSRADVYREAGWPADDGDALDPMVLSDDPTRPDFAFEPVTEAYEPPRWPDPARPQHLHLDVGVADLASAEALVRTHGATLLVDAGDHRTYADAVGHPFCLYPVDDPAGAGRILRIVLDGPDTAALDAFYGALLSDGRAAGPALAFQPIVDHRPTTWPQPGRPQQVHLDLDADDPEAARELAALLGGHRNPQRGGGHVFADPAGHLLCLGDG